MSGVPPGRRSINDLLDEARERLDRVDPREAREAIERGDAVLVDIRSDPQRAEDGVVPGAVFHRRNVLEWRLDPTSPWRLAVAGDPDRRIVLVCTEGYSSSLAARTLQQLGLTRATDLAGGFVAWAAYVAEVQAGEIATERRVATH